MLNEDRIKLMTHMAFYEENEGKETIPIGKYFQSDYIAFHMVKTAICVTIAYVVIVGLWVSCNIEALLESLNHLDVIYLVKKALLAYVFLIGIYMLIAFVVYYLKYRAAKRSLKKYYLQLKKNSAYYEAESNGRTARRENLGGRRSHDNITGL